MLIKRAFRYFSRAKYLTDGGYRSRMLVARARLQERIAREIEVNSMILRDEARVGDSEDPLLDEILGPSERKGH